MVSKLCGQADITEHRSAQKPTLSIVYSWLLITFLSFLNHWGSKNDTPKYVTLDFRVLGAQQMQEELFLKFSYLHKDQTCQKKQILLKFHNWRFNSYYWQRDWKPSITPRTHRNLVSGHCLFFRFFSPLKLIYDPSKVARLLLPSPPKRGYLSPNHLTLLWAAPKYISGWINL
jgi:hypothetical protein